ncbi:MAG: serine/threonine protein kinase [bacterium]|nr:serine/threonine protein kinase [bacterium]
MSDTPGGMGDSGRVDPGIPGYSGFERIGKGGFGTVYRARQPKLNRDVAIKVLIVAGLDERARRRFDREQQAMGSLSAHPAIVTVYDSGFTENGLPYLAMELATGGSLADRLDEGGPIAWPEAIDLIAPICAAVGEAHKAGVLHRDIKPDNVLVSGYGVPMLADFGIAGLMEGTATGTSSITATVEHAAPEVLAGEKPDVAADIYSLGSTLHALLTGLSPFRATAEESVLPIIARVATSPPPDLRPHGIPDAVCAVIERAMAKTPTDRFTSAVGFGEALLAAKAASEGHPIQATSTTSPESGPTAATPTIAAAAPPKAVSPAASVPPADPTRVLSEQHRPPAPPKPPTAPGPAPSRTAVPARPPTVAVSAGGPKSESRPIPVPPQRKSRKWVGWTVALVVIAGVAGGVAMLSNLPSDDDPGDVPGDPPMTSAAPVSTSQSPGTTVRQATSTTTTTTGAPGGGSATGDDPVVYVAVPDLGQLTWEDAIQKAESYGLAIEFSGTVALEAGNSMIGRVLDQDPMTGNVPEGTTIRVWLGEEDSSLQEGTAYVVYFEPYETGDGYGFDFEIDADGIDNWVNVFLYVYDQDYNYIESAWPDETYTLNGVLGSYDYFWSDGESYAGSLYIPYGAFPGIGDYYAEILVVDESLSVVYHGDNRFLELRG